MLDKLRRMRAFLSERHRAYRLTFSAPEAQVVLRDLADFCRARETTFHLDQRAHALQEGRREVWLRIQEHLQMSEEDLWELRRPAAGQNPKPEE